MKKEILLIKIAKMLGIFYTHKLYRNYNIGKYTYGRPKILFSNGADLEIGNYTSIANGVAIFLGGNHNIKWVTTYPFPEIDIENVCPSKGNVKIGNDVWIGRNVTILSGVTIGDGAVIGASTVVAKDVEPYSIVVGNPMRLIKYRFRKDIIEDLMKIKWWNWEHEKVLENRDLLCSPDIEGFIKKHKI